MSSPSSLSLHITSSPILHAASNQPSPHSRPHSRISYSTEPPPQPRHPAEGLLSQNNEDGWPDLENDIQGDVDTSWDGGASVLNASGWGLSAADYWNPVDQWNETSSKISDNETTPLISNGPANRHGDYGASTGAYKRDLGERIKDILRACCIPSSAQSSETSSLKSRRSSTSTAGYSPRFRLPDLYDRIKQSQGDNAAPPALQLTNATLSELAADRASLSADDYRQSLRGVVQQMTARPPSSLTDNAACREQAGHLKEKLDEVLAHKPQVPAGRSHDVAATCARIHSGLLALREVAPKKDNGQIANDGLKQKLNKLDEQLRAVALDVISSAGLSGNKLVSFLETAFGRHPDVLYQCTAELDPVRQRAMFDGSRVLRQALGIGTGIWSTMISTAETLGIRSPRNIAASKLPEALSRSVVFLGQSARKEHALAAMNQAIVEAAKQATTEAERQANTQARHAAVSVLAKGLPEVDSAPDGVRKVIGKELRIMRTNQAGKLLATLLAMRSRLGEDDGAWADKLIDKHGVILPHAARHMESVQVSDALIDWLIKELDEYNIKDKALRKALTTNLGNLSERLSGERQVALLPRLFELVEAMPDHPQGQLFICGLIRREMPHIGTTHPELLERIKQLEFDVYPALIARGHAFTKHVLGKNLPDEYFYVRREFDAVLGISKEDSNEIAMKKYEDHIRSVMQNPDEYFMEQGVQHFYHHATRTEVHANFLDEDGGTAYIPPGS